MSSGRSSILARPVICAMQRIAGRISNRDLVGIIGTSSGRAFSSGSNTALIKQLRERTGAPMKDVKAALLQCDWDSEAAFTELRKKGLAAAGKKAGRVAADGLLGVASQQEGRAAAVVEINSETDFVARNDLFQHLVSQVAGAALSVESSPRSESEAAVINLQALEAAKIELNHPKLSGRSTVADAVAEVASIMGENVKIRRGFLLSSSTGIVASYLHSSTQAGIARVAGLLTLEPATSDSQSADHPAELSSLGESLAMHIVAQRPLFLSKDLVAPEALQHEREILTSQALGSGKPPNVIEKMVAGRLSKYVQEVALLEQKYVLDEAKTVKAVLNEFAKQFEKQYNIGQFVRVEVGEGIQREEKNFAAEVAAQAA
ncbi:hypothetical protein R1sor_009828 [Riccia sorocarpa]|uniref:Elongation factor Ts, mitochondrial n=1 Tax=Riccia sorocarpa TaxID=122646 RepID=A0ABD3HYZ9_9MARC